MGTKAFGKGSECTKVLNYLNTGKKLTVIKAIDLKLTFNLRSRISELKSAGHNIKDEWIYPSNGAKYKKYWIEIE